MRYVLAASAAVAALAVQAVPAAAQPVWSGEGRLENRDPQTPDGNRYDEHAIRLEAGQRYRIAVDSEDFDPVAELYRRGEAEPVAENDDSAGLNPRIRYTPEAGGDYVLRVRGYSADGRGAYTASAEIMPPPQPPITVPGVRTPVSGAWLIWNGGLSEDDAEQDGRHYDDYLVHFAAGQTRYISVEAAGFDTLVQIIAPDTRDDDPPGIIDGDDDAGVELNSLMAFRAEEAGDYIVRVTSYGGVEPGSGAYRLAISE